MKKIRMLTSIILALVLLSACGKAEKFLYKRDVETFNTSSLLFVYDDFSNKKNAEKLESVWSEAEDILKNVENLVSVDKESSDVYRFNIASFGEKVEISETTKELFLIAKEAYTLSGGLFDPTVYPLVDLWGFSPRFSDDYTPTEKYDRKRSSNGSLPLPSDEYVEAFKSLVGFDKIELIEEGGKNYLFKGIESVTVDGVTYQAKIDFGGIAKGYATDKVLTLMKDCGYAEGYFSCGTSSIAFLESGSERATDKTFELDIRKPRQTDENGNSFASLRIKNACVSTSGDYEKYYVTGGVRYCHVINPETGRPINADGATKKIMSVTLIGKNAALIDALSTAVIEMSVFEAKEFLFKNKLEAVVSYEEGGEYKVFTTLQKNDVTIKDENFAFE